MPTQPRSARLVLEDGTVFRGRAFGACEKPLSSTGEVVFNTAMSGYQESLTVFLRNGQEDIDAQHIDGELGLDAIRDAFEARGLANALVSFQQSLGVADGFLLEVGAQLLEVFHDLVYAVHRLLSQDVAARLRLE